MSDDLVKRKLTIDPMPRKDLAAPPPIGYVARADYEALTAERDDYADQISNLLPAVNREAVEQRKRAETAEADNARLRAELTKAADSLDWADAHLEDAGVVSANVRYGARDARAALNPGKADT
jgi:hypothetical protein